MYPTCCTDSSPGSAQDPRGAQGPSQEIPLRELQTPLLEEAGWHPLVLEASPALVDFDYNQIKSVNKIY